MAALTPRQVLSAPDLVLVDIRPVSERYGSVGFVPGSRSIPALETPEATHRRVLQEIGDRVPVLICLSGKRAEHHAAAGGTGGTGMAHYLKGGVLGWGAAGLPVSGVELQPSADAPSLADFPRHMAACFVGQLVESALDRAEPIDPMQLLERCFARAGVSFAQPTPEGILRVLDEAAIVSVQAGTPLDRVAANLDHMLAHLPASARAWVAA